MGAKRKYEAAEKALEALVWQGRDKRHYGRPINPAVIKTFDHTFLPVPASTWRRMVQTARRNVSSTSAASAVPKPIGMFSGAYLTSCLTFPSNKHRCS